MDHVGSITKSLGEILEKLCVCFSGYIYYGILLTLIGQNVCLNDIRDELKMRQVGCKTRSLGQILEISSVGF